MERQAGLQVVEEGKLSAEALVDAVETALDAPPPGAVGLDTGGAAITAGILRDLATARMTA